MNTYTLVDSYVTLWRNDNRSLSIKHKVTINNSIRTIDQKIVCEDISGIKLELPVDQDQPITPDMLRKAADELEILNNGVEKTIEYWNGILWKQKSPPHLSLL